MLRLKGHKGFQGVKAFRMSNFIGFPGSQSIKAFRVQSFHGGIKEVRVSRLSRMSMLSD